MTAAALAFALGAALFGASLVGGIAGPECLSRDGAEPPTNPNVIVVMTDDQDTGSTRVMRHLKRNVEREGTTFKSFFATFPLCCPSRATFLTGQYPHNHGVRSNKPPEGGYEALDHRDTLPQSLQCEGYRTGFVGKHMNGYGRRGNDADVPPGWDEWFVNTRGGYFDYVMSDNGERRRFGDRERDYRTDVEARWAARFVRESVRQSKPFLLVLSTQAPHTESGGGRPLRPAPRHERRFRDARLPRPPSFNERNVSDKPAFVRERNEKDPGKMRREHRDRLRSLLAVDDALAKLDRVLRRTGVFEDTLLIYTSDNGYFQGEHRLTGKTKAGALYEEAVRVPLVLRGPGIPRDQVREQLAANVDLAPTIVDVAGGDPPRTPDGRSLIPVAQGDPAGGRRDLLLEDLHSKGVRTRDFMYTEHPGGEVELFDLQRDPHQLRSLHDDPDYEILRRVLAERLRELEDCSGDECL